MQLSAFFTAWMIVYVTQLSSAHEYTSGHLSVAMLHNNCSLFWSNLDLPPFLEIGNFDPVKSITAKHTKLIRTFLRTALSGDGSFSPVSYRKDQIK